MRNKAHLLLEGPRVNHSKSFEEVHFLRCNCAGGTFLSVGYFGYKSAAQHLSSPTTIFYFFDSRGNGLCLYSRKNQVPFMLFNAPSYGRKLLIGHTPKMIGLNHRGPWFEGLIPCSTTSSKTGWLLNAKTGRE